MVLQYHQLTCGPRLVDLGSFSHGGGGRWQLSLVEVNM